MSTSISTVSEYISQLEESRKEIIENLRKAVKSNLPAGFNEEINYGMIGYVVPHSIYPSGYHCNTKLPLPFINLASQKNHIGVYHMGIYSDPELLKWFKEEWTKLEIGKLNIGKSCIRLNPKKEIPYDLIGRLSAKISVDQWIETYEKAVKK
ncbi:DUF1801 domain-containing protein [Flavobacteriales bacterium]|nr:DUF1801 domain-containing protein [Flavobacteriales bacterium]